jgi:hypothetical protein
VQQQQGYTQINKLDAISRKDFSPKVNVNAQFSATIGVNVSATSVARATTILQNANKASAFGY